MQSGLLKKHKKTIKKNARSHGVHSIRIFGSFARGEGNVHSDIDLLVELEPKRSLLDIISLKYEIEDLTGRSIDIITKAGISPYLLEKVTREAVAL